MLNAYAKLQDWIYELTHDDEGQGMTEYVLILALVAVALFAAVTFTDLGDSLGDAVGRVVDSVDAQS